MRILTLIHEYPPIGGGGGRVAQDLARSLVKRGHEVRVIAPNHNSLNGDNNASDGVQVIRISSFRSKQFAADLLAMSGYVSVGLVVGLWQILTWKPNIIHVHFAVPAGVLTWMLHKLTRVPYVLTAHLGDVPGGVPEKTDAWFKWVYPFTHRIWRDAAQVTAISEHTRRLALAHYPVEIEVIPNGIELDRDFPESLDSVNTPPQIVFAGRFVPQKNPLQAVRILSQVADLPWKAVMIGDGVLLEQTRSEIQKLGLGERITLTGWIVPELVQAHFAQSDILLLPSLSEGIPMVGLQALVSGHAIVASRVGGMLDLVQVGENGFLHEPSDVDGFVANLRSLLADPAVLLRARNASLKISHKFDLTHIVDRYEQIFLKVASKAPPNNGPSRPFWKDQFISGVDPGMKRIPLIFIFITIFVDVLGYSMIVPLLPFFVQKLGGGAAIAGTLASLYAFLQLFSGPVLGSLSDRLGRKPILLVCLFGTAIAYAMFGVANALWMLFVAVVLDGLTGNNLTTAHAYIADITTLEERARGMGMAGAAFGLGLMAGPVIGGLLSSYGLFVPAFTAAGVALVNVIYGLFFLPESLLPEKRSTHPVSFNAFTQLKGLFDLPAVRLLLLAIFSLNLAFSGLQTNFPLFSNARFDWDARQNGLFFAFVGVVAVFVQGFLFGRLQPKVGEKRLALIGLGFLAVGMAGIALAPFPWTLFPLVAVAAFGSGSSIPSLSGLVSTRISATQQGQLMGGMQTLLGLTTIVGPTLAGLSFEHVGVSTPYWIGSGFALLALMIAARDFSRRI